MHISNDRYFEDRQRHDLALRMIRHEARTCTIRSCTGLSDDRIRRLYQTYASHVPEVPIRRHRGKSPRQISFFTRNTQAQFESSLLAGLFAAFGLLESPQDAHAISLSAGTLFCDAYETHVQLLGSSTLSFEHAWFLLHLLRRNTGVGTSRCRHCEGQFLHDRSTVLRRACPACTLKGSRGKMEQLRRSVRNRLQQPSAQVIAEALAPQAPDLADRLPA
jgi:hypothetical protein